MTHLDLLTQLERAGLCSRNAGLQPLAGGVSSDILLVTDGATQFVVKQALPKLRVEAEWHADVSRNGVEQDFLRYVSRIAPGSVPEVLYADRVQGFFVMEYLGESLLNWKQLLLSGHLETRQAFGAGALLGKIHAASWGEPNVAAQFQTFRNFFQLRVEPYLLATAQKHTTVRPYLIAEAERLANMAECLVHGDFSPKNILVGNGRLVLLDCEVAWFGDPAFDTSFLLNHLFLKSIHLHERGKDFLQLVDSAWQGYCSQMSDTQIAEIEQRTCHLLPMLMLARVDGKSPAEYLTDGNKKQTIRRFAEDAILNRFKDLPQLRETWGQLIDTHYGRRS